MINYILYKNKNMEWEKNTVTRFHSTNSIWLSREFVICVNKLSCKRNWRTNLLVNFVSRVPVRLILFLLFLQKSLMYVLYQQTLSEVILMRGQYTFSNKNSHKYQAAFCLLNNYSGIVLRNTRNCNDFICEPFGWLEEFVVYYIYTKSLDR